MKLAHIGMIIFVLALLVGCGDKHQKEEKTIADTAPSAPEPGSEEEADSQEYAEIEETFVAEEDDVDIGDMI